LEFRFIRFVAASVSLAGFLPACKRDACGYEPEVA
jgi:hypothetical protein